MFLHSLCPQYVLQTPKITTSQYDTYSMIREDSPELAGSISRLILCDTRPVNVKVWMVCGNLKISNKYPEVGFSNEKFLKSFDVNVK
jgi:hypothetical protein